MKRILALGMGLMILLAVFVGRANENLTIKNQKEAGPFTSDNGNAFANNVPVVIDNSTLQTCYDYAKSLSYEIKDTDKYQSVILGKSNVDVVYIHDGDDVKRELVDEGDYLIIFEEIRIVIDVETGIALGTIPYV